MISIRRVSLRKCKYLISRWMEDSCVFFGNLFLDRMEFADGKPTSKKRLVAQVLGAILRLITVCGNCH